MQNWNNTKLKEWKEWKRKHELLVSLIGNMLLLCSTSDFILLNHIALILLLLHRFPYYYCHILVTSFFFFWTHFFTCFLLHVGNTHLDKTFLSELLGGLWNVVPNGLFKTYVWIGTGPELFVKCLRVDNCICFHFDWRV